MRLNDYFDEVVYINLDRRPDRRANIETLLVANDIKATRIVAIDDGCEGCFKSHQKARQHLIDHPEWRNMLVLEDDIEELTPAAVHLYRMSLDVLKVHATLLEGKGSLQDRFSALIPYIVPDWSVLYLGSSFIEPFPIRINKHLLQCYEVPGAHAYGITREHAILMNKRFPVYEGRNDDTYRLIRRKLNLTYYCVSPRLFFTVPGFSDLENIVTDRSSFTTDPKLELSI